MWSQQGLFGEGPLVPSALKRAETRHILLLFLIVCPHQGRAKKSSATLGGTKKALVPSKSKMHESKLLLGQYRDISEYRKSRLTSKVTRKGSAAQLLKQLLGRTC